MMCSRPARDAPTSTAWPATCIRVRPPPPRGPSRAPSKRQHARSAHMLQRKGSGSGSGGGALAAACLLLSGRLGSYSPMSRARRVMLWGGRARSVTCMAGGRLSAPHFFFFDRTSEKEAFSRPETASDGAGWDLRKISVFCVCS